MKSHFINGAWTAAATADSFQAFSPVQDVFLPARFAQGGAAEVEQAAQAATSALPAYAALSDAERAAFLRAIAGGIERRADDIRTAAAAETALPAARLDGERGRTVGQLNMFADFIESGAHLDRRADAALPSRTPPRPDLQLVHAPLGVVAVFGASNFPLAFSVAGGDTASALAAGCPVIVKGHPAHPATGELVAAAVAEAMDECALPAGTFAFIQGDTPELSRQLVAHPAVSAVGFTGSLRAGRALFDVACQRPSPIPFYAEMGSINPVFVLDAAAQQSCSDIAQGWAQSLTLGGGQFCTNPGVVFCPAAQSDSFTAAAAAALAECAAHTLLTPAIAAAYRQATAAAAAHLHWQGECAEGGCKVPAHIFCSNLSDWLATPSLQQEIFGPAGVIVSYQNTEELAQAIATLEGQLTATLWLTESDHDTARGVLPLLEKKAGRLICNGFPTGVEVADAMMHGGPYPAATTPSTSVGSMAIRRFLRPLCRQNFPQALLAVSG